MKNIITQEEKNRIDEVCEKYYITNYTINLDGSIDVNGNVGLRNRKLSKLPLRFGKVSGYFNCAWNDLTSLVGCPSEVGGYFNCYENELTSLEGCPRQVTGNFNCNSNKLNSLEFCISTVGGDFICSDNKLPNLFKELFYPLTMDERRIFLKYQHQFFIWDDGGYDHEAALDMVNEIRTGLL